MTRRTYSSPLWDRRRWLQQVGLGLGSLALGGLGGCGGGDETASTLSSGWSWPTGMTARWDHLPSTGLVQAQAVHSSSGAVSEASALLGNTACTLGAGARVVLDFGSVVGGVPALNIDAFSGAPELSLSFSESAQWIDGGDATLGFSIASEPERAVSWSVTATGLWQGRVLQGGQRWMTVQVGGSGSVTLRQPGLQAVTIAPPADHDSTGWFRCSDTLLEAIWMAGARTCELNRMAAGSQPRPWRLTDAGADIGPSGLALHQGGTGWTTGTLSFTLTVNRGGLGWVVRGSKLTRLSFTLCAADDAEHPDTLLIETGSIFIGGVHTLSRQTLPATLPTGRSVQVTTVVGDSLIDVSIDGQTVASVSVAEIGFLPAGSIGFFNRSDCAAVVTALRVSDSGGGTLFSSPLTAAEQASVEQAFPVGTNGLPLLTDGAKRERQVFSMDLVAAAPTLYCTSGAHAHVAGSLRLLCAYPATDGQLASSLDPALSLTPLAASAAPQMRWYSASYSAHTVIALAEHWRQSGDLALVRELWSAVSGEIAWLLAQVGSQGLVVTDSGNGLDWHPQFGGPVVGAAGLTNLIVVKALLDAAELAKAQGLTSSATAWQAQAADLQAAMDSLLQDTSTGLYEVSDSRRGLVAQDVNALAVLWDRMPQERALQILDRLEATLATEQGHRAFSGDSAWSGVISPMVSGFEVAALFRAGRGNAALQLIRAGWRMMIEHATHACGTTWESMTDQGVPSGPDVSLAHAWSSGPTAALSRHVLGLRPLQAGWSRWLCKPVLGDLSWAAGQVPTPQGALGVRWLRAPTDGLALALRLQVPEGTSGVLALPLSLGRGAVRVNGSAVTLQDALDQDSDLDQASHRWLSLSAGTHQIEVDSV